MDNGEQLSDIAWFCGAPDPETGGDCITTTQPVRGLAPNPWGLYDMHGNVWDWCHDGWDGTDYSGDATDPWGMGPSDFRVNRGGSFDTPGANLRSAKRNGDAADYMVPRLGFRLVITR